MGVSHDHMTWGFPSLLKIVASQPTRPITTNELEILFFLRQNIVRKLCEEAARQGCPRLTHGWSGQSWITLILARPPTGSSTLGATVGPFVFRWVSVVLSSCHPTGNSPCVEWQEMWRTTKYSPIAGWDGRLERIWEQLSRSTGWRWEPAHKTVGLQRLQHSE